MIWNCYEQTPDVNEHSETCWVFDSIRQRPAVQSKLRRSKQANTNLKTSEEWIILNDGLQDLTRQNYWHVICDPRFD